MADLGEFGAAPSTDLDLVDAEPDTFRFHGETFTLRVQMSALPMLRFAEECSDLEKRAKAVKRAENRIRTDTDKDNVLKERADIAMQEQAAVYRYLRSTIREEEWGVFEETALRAGSDVDELIGVSNAVIAAVSARPTRRSSDSRAGEQRTPTSSAAAPQLGGGPRVVDEEGAPAREATDQEVAAALGISEREAQRRRWASEMVPFEEALASGVSI